MDYTYVPILSKLSKKGEILRIPSPLHKNVSIQTLRGRVRWGSLIFGGSQMPDKLIITRLFTLTCSTVNWCSPWSLFLRAKTIQGSRHRGGESMGAITIIAEQSAAVNTYRKGNPKMKTSQGAGDFSIFDCLFPHLTRN